MRVYIVARSPLSLAGLENILSGRGVEVAGSAAEIEFLPEQLFTTHSDIAPIIIVLLSHGSTESSESPDAILASPVWDDLPEARVVILADDVSAMRRVSALRSGIRAILPTDISPDQLVAALEAVASGLLVMHPAEVSSLFQPASPASRPLAELAEPLTPREREVLQMLASGRGNKEIADRLNISEHTVKFHVTSILGKLGAESRTAAVAIGIRRGLVLL